MLDLLCSALRVAGTGWCLFSSAQCMVRGPLCHAALRPAAPCCTMLCCALMRRAVLPPSALDHPRAYPRMLHQFINPSFLHSALLKACSPC